MGTYYPSLVVNFEILFDELILQQAGVGTPSTPTPVSSAERVANPPQTGSGPDITVATVSMDGRNITFQDATNVGGSSQQASTLPKIVHRESVGSSFILGRVPKKASMELPGFRQAANFSFTFDFKDIPIDPRAVRAASVKIHLGTVAADDFARGMRGKDNDGTRGSILNPILEGKDSNLLFIGIVDEWKVEHGDTGSEITIEGRDPRGILIESPVGVSPTDTIQILDALDFSLRIDKLVVQILSFHPQGAKFNVRTNASDWPHNTVPASYATDLVPRHRRGAHGNRRGGRGTPPGDHNKLSYWDLITRSCTLVGAVPYFEGTYMVIRPVRSLFDQDRLFNPNVATPFRPDKDRTVSDNPISHRYMLYGDNISKIEFRRKFAGQAKPKIIHCVGVNLDSTENGTKTCIEGIWPPEDADPTNHQGVRRTNVSPGGETSHEEIWYIPISGIKDKTRLAEIARNLFEEISRGEFTGSCETKDLSSLGGGNGDPDLLRLRPGDTVEFQTDVRGLQTRNPLVSTLTDFSRDSDSSLIEQFTQRLGDRNLARVVVATSRGSISAFLRQFRVSNIKYDWSTASGISVGFDFQNYFVERFADVNGQSSDSGRGSVNQEVVPDVTVSTISNVTRHSNTVTFQEATNVRVRRPQ